MALVSHIKQSRLWHIVKAAFVENGGVIDVKPGSAAHGKIAIGDAILEINGMSLNGMDREAVKTYIANKWGSGASLIMLVQHDGEKNFVTLKKGEQDYKRYYLA